MISKRLTKLLGSAADPGAGRCGMRRRRRQCSRDHGSSRWRRNHSRRWRGDEGCIRPRRPRGRQGMVVGPRPGHEVPRSQHERRDHDPREHSRGLRLTARLRGPGRRRQHADLRHVVRLHGSDAGGGRQLPGRVVHARHRLQDRRQHGQLLRRSRRGPLPERHGRRCGHESNLIGYVAAFPIPEVLRGINAFTLGVQEVNPDAKVQVVWTSTWFDPPKEGTAAQSLLDAGADVIAMHQDSAAPGQTAEAAGAKWVGYNTDMTEFAPDRLADRSDLGLGSVLPRDRPSRPTVPAHRVRLRHHGRRHGRHCTIR